MNHKPRGTSGKFQVEPLYGVEDIRRFLRLLPNGCIKAPNPPPFGNLREGVWYLQIGELTPTGRRKIKTAVGMLFDFHWPHSQRKHGSLSSYRLARTCETAACMNYRHYELINRKDNSFGEQYMAKQEIINLMTAALAGDESVTFGDGASAESFRMHIYRLKRKWKKENSPYHLMFEGVVIKRDKLHDNILDFTTNSRSFDSVLARFKDAPNGSIEEPMSVEEKAYLDDVITGKDHGKETLSDLGYGVPVQVQVTENTTPTYDTCYAKACAGGVLTKQEEEILQAGPTSEGEGEG